MSTDAESFVAAMAPALRQAASIARALEGRVQNRPKWGEESAVKAALTLADSAAQEAILVPLLERFPGVALRAEEDTPSVRSFPTRKRTSGSSSTRSTGPCAATWKERGPTP